MKGLYVDWQRKGGEVRLEETRRGMQEFKFLNGWGRVTCESPPHVCAYIGHLLYMSYHYHVNLTLIYASGALGYIFDRRVNKNFQWLPRRKLPQTPLRLDLPKPHSLVTLAGKGTFNAVLWSGSWYGNLRHATDTFLRDSFLLSGWSKGWAIRYQVLHVDIFVAMHATQEWNGETTHKKPKKSSHFIKLITGFLIETIECLFWKTSAQKDAKASRAWI